MAYSAYHKVKFHYLFLLSIYLECSFSNLLSCAELWYLFCVHLHALTQSVMAPVVRVEPCEMKLLDLNPELSAKVEAIGWMSFISKFSDSNPEVTRVFALSLVDFQVEVGDLHFPVDERSVAVATGLSLTGERWFKYKRMDITEWPAPKEPWSRSIIPQWSSSQVLQKGVAPYSGFDPQIPDL